MREPRSKPAVRVVIESVGTAADAIDRVGAVLPDVVILDHDLPDADGASVVSSIKAACPACRVLMLSSYTDPVILSEAFDAGCDGFVTKRHGASEILSAVLAVASNETPVSPDMVRSLVRRDYVGLGSDLTERELEVLRLASLGHSNADAGWRIRQRRDGIEFGRALTPPLLLEAGRAAPA